MSLSIQKHSRAIKINIKSLSIILCSITLTLFIPHAFAELDTSTPAISPEIKRDARKAPVIDTEKFETTAYIGAYKMDGFRAEPIAGVRINFHSSDLFFVEGSVAKGQAKDINLDKSGRGSVFDGETMNYMNISLGINILPGQIFIGKNRAINTTFYLATGMGRLSVDQEHYSSLHFGGGLRAIPTDWLSYHMDVRSYFLNKNFLDPDDTSHNIEYTFGVGLFF